MSRLAHARRATPASTVAPARPRERGSVLVTVALSLAVVVVCTALTVDLGRVSVLRRDLQNVADAAALDLVRLVDGRSAGAIVGDERWAATLAGSRARNDGSLGPDATVTARLGSHDATTGAFRPVASAAEIPSAVEVVASDRIEHELAPGGTDTSRRAVAAQAAAAGIQLGSFAARLDSAQSALLGPLVGEAIGVDLAGYSGLAGGRVGIDALATELGLSLGSPDELLATGVTVADLALAQAAVLRRGGDVARAVLLERLAVDVDPTIAPIALGDLLTVVPGGQAAAATATLDVLELLTTAAWVANGDRFLDIPGLDLGVPGLASTGVRLQVIERPRVAFGGPGTRVETAQVRLETRVDLSAAGLVGVHLDVAVTAAPSQATIREVSCGRPQVVGLDVTTGLATVEASVGGRIAVDLLGLLGATVAEVSADAEAGHDPETLAVDFVLPPDVLGRSQPVTARDLGLGDLAVDLRLAVLPQAELPPLLRTVLALVTTTAETVVATVLAPLVATALDAVDATVVQPLLALLGVTLPGADVTPLAVRCSTPRLVT
ncbi:MAG TPA: pilus assembly protein TadG-related protein [Iamia sp.]|nr:pilus assembly protein TadG-related protein [Iamia sp.]